LAVIGTSSSSMEVNVSIHEVIFRCQSHRPGLVDQYFKKGYVSRSAHLCFFDPDQVPLPASVCSEAMRLDALADAPELATGASIGVDEVSLICCPVRLVAALNGPCTYHDSAAVQCSREHCLLYRISEFSLITKAL
jgi:hypothetical protein